MRRMPHNEAPKDGNWGFWTDLWCGAESHTKTMRVGLSPPGPSAAIID